METAAIVSHTVPVVLPPASNDADHPGSGSVLLVTISQMNQESSKACARFTLFNERVCLLSTARKFVKEKLTICDGHILYLCSSSSPLAARKQVMMAASCKRGKVTCSQSCFHGRDIMFNKQIEANL